MHCLHNPWLLSHIRTLNVGDPTALQSDRRYTYGPYSTDLGLIKTRADDAIAALQLVLVHAHQVGRKCIGGFSLATSICNLSKWLSCIGPVSQPFSNCNLLLMSVTNTAWKELEGMMCTHALDLFICAMTKARPPDVPGACAHHVNAVFSNDEQPWAAINKREDPEAESLGCQARPLDVCLSRA